MLYLLEVCALFAGLMFAASGIVILVLFGIFQLKALIVATARLTTSFANRVAISRTFSRSDERVQLVSEKSQ